MTTLISVTNLTNNSEKHSPDKFYVNAQEEKIVELQKRNKVYSVIQTMINVSK
jgi:hypothetical protein